jgi:hypothetical protein
VPVVKRGWVKVGIIGPYEGVNFRIKAHLIEKREITQKVIVVPIQDRFKVNLLFRTIIKGNAQCVRSNNLKIGYLDYQVVHSLITPVIRVVRDKRTAAAGILGAQYLLLFPFPGEIISHGVWLYYRFSLNYRDVEKLSPQLSPTGRPKALDPGEPLRLYPTPS